MSALLCLCLAELLLPQLGDRSFRRRESASRALAALGRPALPALERDQSHPDPEVARRCSRLLSPYRHELADRDSRKILPSRYPVLPWLDLPDGEMGLYLEPAIRSLSGTRTSGSPHWPEYREGTRLWVRGQLLQRRPLKEIRAGLDRMVTAERDFIARCGHNYNPPLKPADAP